MFIKYSGINITILLSVFLILCVSVNSHSGKTDGQGGHHDYNNLSKLGDYHYHCGGYPAHLHDDGACPYTTDKPSNEESPPETLSIFTSVNTSTVEINGKDNFKEFVVVGITVFVSTVTTIYVKTKNN